LRLRGQAVEISLLVKQAGLDVSGGDRSPAIVFPLTVQSQVDTQISLGMFYGKSGRIQKPGTGWHHCTGRNQIKTVQISIGRDGGLAHADVIHVDNDDVVVIR
jgi:hypothetical protein